MRKMIFIPVLLFCVSFTTVEEQLFNTSLTITVRDELGNTVEEATVQLYEKEADYTAEKNKVAETITDVKGIAKFKKLQAIPYYVLVRKDDKNNIGGGEQTGPLVEGKFNKVTIVIE